MEREATEEPRRPDRGGVEDLGTDESEFASVEDVGSPPGEAPPVDDV